MNTIAIRSLAIGISILSVLAFGSARTAFAQPGTPLAGSPGFTLSFDEKGSGIVNGVPYAGLPVGGGGIQFLLPGQISPGFVLITNPSVDSTVSNPNGDTDLLTFSNQTIASGQTVGVMLFQSLIDDADDIAPADTSVLNYLQPVITILETGPEGNNSFQWIAGSAIYNGISDGVLPSPEPSTFVMGGMGLLSLAALAYRRRLARFAVASLLFVSMAFGTATVAHAQLAPGSSISGTVGFTFAFDEQGNSLLNGGPNPNTVFLMPGGGIQFTLPGPVIPGDVLVRGLSDVNPGNNGISDLLSFSNNTANQGILTYLSLIDDANDTDAADHPNFNTVTPYSVNEVGPEGANGFQWIPDPANLSGAIYNGVSDGVLPSPEPSTFILGGLGLLSLAAVAYRRRLARTR
jgi:hypothetical protein